MTAPLVLDAAQVQALLGRIDLRATLTRMFQALAAGRAVQPPQTLSLFPGGGGDFITYLGVLADQGVFGAKLSPYIPGTEGALVTAWTLLMSMTSGEPLLLCDSKRLTIERTAGTTALAVDLLAPAEAGVLVIVGAGSVGLAHLRHVIGLRPWRAIRLCSPRIGTRPEATALAARDTRLSLHADTNAALDGADVAMLCTSSGVPVVDVAALDRSILITSISTNVADAHEVAPEALAGMDVYCDYRATTPHSAGEMRLATRAGRWTSDRLRGDLPELLAGAAPPPTRERPTFFRSIGLGLEDVAVAAALLAVAR